MNVTELEEKLRLISDSHKPVTVLTKYGMAEILDVVEPKASKNIWLLAEHKDSE